MNYENLIGQMMTLNNQARIWHWRTTSAQHHTVYENFLTENEELTDRLVEATLGNDLSFDFSKLQIKVHETEYSLENSRTDIRNYKSAILETKASFEEKSEPAYGELVTILDDVLELSSKTLYLLKLS